MIEGLMLDFTSDELKALIQARIEKRKDNISVLRKQHTALKAADIQGVGGTTSSNAAGVDAIESKIHQYGRTIDKLEIYITHLVPNEVYRVSEADLEKVDIISNRW